MRCRPHISSVILSETKAKDDKEGRTSEAYNRSTGGASHALKGFPLRGSCRADVGGVTDEVSCEHIVGHVAFVLHLIRFSPNMRKPPSPQGEGLGTRILVGVVDPYLISCSRSLNNSESKKSCMDISNPSHIFFIVDTVVLLFCLFTILLSVD